MSRDARREKIRALVKWSLMVLLTLGATAAYILFDWACGLDWVETGPGSLYAAHLARTGAGAPRMLVVSQAGRTSEFYTGSDWRIDLVDPATGQRLLRRIFEYAGRPELLPAAPGRFWCESAGKLELRDVDTLDVIASHGSLVQRNPPLAAGLHGPIKVDGWSGSAIVTTNSGSSLLLDSRTLVARPFVPAREQVHMDTGGDMTLEALRAAKLPDGPLPLKARERFLEHAFVRSPRQRAALRTLPRIRTLGASQHGSASGGSVGNRDCGFVTVDGGSREALQIEHDREKVTRPQSTFLSPKLLLAYDTERALTLQDEDGLVVAHSSSLDRNTGQLLLSHLSLDGTLHWTVTAPPGPIAMATVVDDILVVAIEAERGLIVGIAWQDGEVRWRLQI